MINLAKYDKEVNVIVPVVNGNFQYNRKKFITGTNESGWFKVEIRGNITKVLNKEIVELLKFSKSIKGYTYYDKIIFANFDEAKRKLNKEIMTDLCLNTSMSFNSIEAIIWEDKNIYYYKPNYNDFKIQTLANYFNQDMKIDFLKGITPELKTVYLFHVLEKQRIILEQEKRRKKEELEQFKKTLEGRLFLAFNTVGAKILNYSQRNDILEVNWEADGNKFNSLIDVNTFRIVEAGYCMSGYDKDHSVTSMVELAKDYEEQNLIYKTRL